MVYLCSERGVNKLLDERRRFRLRLSWWKLCIEVGEHYFYYVRELGIGKGEPDIGLILIQHLSTQIPHFLLQVSNSYTQIFLEHFCLCLSTFWYSHKCNGGNVGYLPQEYFVAWTARVWDWLTWSSFLQEEIVGLISVDKRTLVSFTD